MFGGNFWDPFLKWAEAAWSQVSGKKKILEIRREMAELQEHKVLLPTHFKICFFFYSILIDIPFLHIFSSITRERTVGSTRFKN